ncbi:WD40 repeat-like protein [Neoconidiobolus thromboides FSU 785]|nr:WD40 repeat-like protein [Neoconidiobolus thromboides FSU 785]
MKWIVTGGEDAYIRKYDFFSSINGKVPLTMAQRHATVDVCSKAGIITSYWDNQITLPQNNRPISGNDPRFEESFSPVYSIYLESKAVWCLSGLKNGDINLYTVRHEEGKLHHVFREHGEPVSVLKTFNNEKALISGSWDKSIKIWDLNNGTKITDLSFHANQITSINHHPNNENNIILSTSFDGNSFLWDLRMKLNDIKNQPIASISVPENTPKWALSSCFNKDGNVIFTGRRNSTVDSFDLRMNKFSNTLLLPNSSGAISALASHPIKNFLMIGSYDNLRMWNLDNNGTNNTINTNNINNYLIPYQLVPGHQTGMISQIVIDDSGKYMATTSGNRGWEGISANTTIFYEIKFN